MWVFWVLFFFFFFFWGCFFSDSHTPDANITDICICFISLQCYISDFLLMALNIVHILGIYEKRKIPHTERQMDKMVRDFFFLNSDTHKDRT